VQPNTVDKPAINSTRRVPAPGALSIAPRIAANTSIISAGVLRTFATLCAVLTEIGATIRCTPDSSARSAPFRFGTRAVTIRSS